MIEIKISETGRNRIVNEPHTFNVETLTFENIEAVKQGLVERYGKLPKGKRKIYQDTKDGKTLAVGFLHSFWNADLSHYPVQKWYQTDWICVYDVDYKPIKLI